MDSDDEQPQPPPRRASSPPPQPAPSALPPLRRRRLVCKAPPEADQAATTPWGPSSSSSARLQEAVTGLALDQSITNPMNWSPKAAFPGYQWDPIQPNMHEWKFKPILPETWEADDTVRAPMSVSWVELAIDFTIVTGLPLVTPQENASDAKIVRMARYFSTAAMRMAQLCKCKLAPRETHAEI
eukprot:7083905-Pyramimonas_sp.AAC.1